MATETRELRVGGGTPVPDLASAISHAIYDGQEVVCRCIGAASISQAIKAVAVARGYVAPRGIDLYLIPGFIDIPVPDMEGKHTTGIVLRIMTR